MRQKVEELRNGKFDYELPELIFSEERISISIRAGETMKGGLVLRSADGRAFRGFATSSSRRMVPGFYRFQGSEIRFPYGVDAAGLRPGEHFEGELTFTTSIGEYKIPFEVHTDSNEIRNSSGELMSLEEFSRMAKNDFREAFRVFNSEEFGRITEGEGSRMSALCRGFSRQPVTYQHLEEFLISAGMKEKVTLTADKLEEEYYLLTESRRESFSIHRSGWGHLRLEITAQGGFVEPMKKVVTDEDFIGTRYDVEYLLHADQLTTGRSCGRIIVQSPYQKVVFSIVASAGPKLDADVAGMEKKIRLSMEKEFLNYLCRKITFSEMAANARTWFARLESSGFYFPEYQMFEVWLLQQEGKKDQACAILKNYLNKAYRKEEMTLAGTFLYLSCETGLVSDRAQVLSRLQNLYMQQGDSFLLLYYLLKLDPELEGSPSRCLARMEELYERGCCSPFLYHMAWKTVCDDVNALRHLSGFWTQVFLFAAKKDLLVSELCMRYAYLTGYEKEFRPLVYKVLAKSYEKFPSDDTLESLCKYIIRGNPRKPEYFRWFSLAVDSGLRLTRLYEYYIETMDTSRHMPLPRSLMMYFKYNNDSLGDSRKAFIYSGVVLNKAEDMATYELYEEHMRSFTLRMLQQGRISEDYAVLYREFLSGPRDSAQAAALSRIMMTCRLYSDDERIRQVVVCHDQLSREEIYPVTKGVCYPRIYTSDAVILFQDEKQRRYEATVDYNLVKLMDTPALVEQVLKAGCEEAGLFLNYVENHKVSRENLAVYEAASRSDGLSEAFRRKLKQEILKFFAEEAQGKDLDGFLDRIDYSDYVYVDKERLLDVLIDNGLYEKAMEIIEEYGSEGLGKRRRFILASAMIRESHYAEDEELLSMAQESFHDGTWDESILGYLAKWVNGPIDEMIHLRRVMASEGMDTSQTEEKILCLLMFASDYRKEGEEVLFDHIRHGGSEEVTGAYLSMLAYGCFVKENPMSPYLLKVLIEAREKQWETDKVCGLALLKELSRGKSGQPNAQEIENEILKECMQDGLQFSFFRRLTAQQLSPWQLDDKVFVEIHENPDARVMLSYRMDTGLGELTPYRTEPLHNMYEGIFNRCFTLFYGESIHYYFQVEKEGKVNRTSERTLSMSRVEGASSSRYQRINQMLSARRQGKKQELRDKIRQYQLQETYVKEIFRIR